MTALTISSSSVKIPKSSISFVSDSVVETIPFSDTRDGMIIAIETPLGSKPLDNIFTHALTELRPVWHHIRDTSSLEGCDIYNKDFYYRALKLSPCGTGFEVLDQSVMEEFWLGCSYEVLSSCFLNEAKAAAFKTNALVIQSSTPWSITYAGRHYTLMDPSRPQYILELATRKDTFKTSLMFERLLHKSFHDQWLSHIPEQEPVLRTIISVVAKDHAVISAKLAALGSMFMKIPETVEDPRYLLINKLGHRLEAFLIRNSTAYGLTSFVDYQVINITDEASFGLVTTAQRTCRAYCRLFEPQFEFRLNHKSKLVAFKMNGWDNFLDLLTQTHTTGLTLKTKDLDHAIMVWIKALNVLHSGGCQLNAPMLDRLFCKFSPEGKFEFKIFLTAGSAYTDGLNDQTQFAMMIYNLWSRYRLHGDMDSFIDTSKIDAGTIADVIAACEALKTNKSVTPMYVEKFDFIVNLLRGSMTLKEFSLAFEIHYNRFHFGLAPPKGL